MPKPVIGRKLDTLMGPSRSGETLPPALPGETKPTGSGVGSLIRGQAPVVAPVRPRFPRWYLFGADLLLVALALLVMYKSPVPLTGGEKVLGVIAVVLGAALALIATCMKDSKKS